MKKLIAVFILSLLIASCSTDFNVTTSWKDITIVYGLLDVSDTAQYMKVGKAYLDPSTNALSIAQNSDSLYYKELNVVLYDNVSGVTIQLEKVDGNLEGLVKDTGIFANTPNTLYKTTQPLNQNDNYTLIATEPDNGKQVTATTQVVNDFQVIKPSPAFKINFLPKLKTSVNWNPALDGKIYDLTVRFHYTEYQSNNTAIHEDKTLDWLVFQNFRSPSTTSVNALVFDIFNDNLYTYLNFAIPDNPAVVRIMRSCDFIFSVGGQELDTYNQVFIAQQGLTSGQVLPTYTNIDNGLGLFSSRFHKTVSNIIIDGRTQDSIACNLLTSHLNFLTEDSVLCQ